MTHDHEDGFEAGCPACELNEVSLQDTGRPWAARAIASHPMYAATRRHFAASPMPGQRTERGAA
ncbi:hypothetical protein [Streptomyces prunicolor]